MPTSITSLWYSTASLKLNPMLWTPATVILIFSMFSIFSCRIFSADTSWSSSSLHWDWLYFNHQWYTWNYVTLDVFQMAWFKERDVRDKMHISPGLGRGWKILPTCTGQDRFFADCRPNVIEYTSSHPLVYWHQCMACGGGAPTLHLLFHHRCLQWLKAWKNRGADPFFDALYDSHLASEVCVPGVRIYYLGSRWSEIELAALRFHTPIFKTLKCHHFSYHSAQKYIGYQFKDNCVPTWNGIWSLQKLHL